MAHKGGERFKTDSPEFQILADWIASGECNSDPQLASAAKTQARRNPTSLTPPQVFIAERPSMITATTTSMLRDPIATVTPELRQPAQDAHVNCD